MAQNNNSLLSDLAGEISYKDWFNFGLSGLNTIAQASTDAANSRSASAEFSLIATQNQINSERMINNVDSITSEYSNQLNALKYKQLSTVSEQKEAMSTSGFDVNSGSYVDMINQTNYEASKIAAALTVSYKTDLAENEYQSKILGIQAALNRTKSEIELKRAKLQKYNQIAGGFQTLSAVTGAYGTYKSENK
jgi:hypothetical protein